MPRRAFPLISRHRMTGMAYGTQRSLRRGQGAEIAGAREYRPGDKLAWIDWNASAKLSVARNDDVFVVRQHYAEIVPRVVILVDRRPSMALFPADLPWLSKRGVLREATTAIVAAAHAARAYVGYTDVAGKSAGHDAAPYWIPPHRQDAVRILDRLGGEFDAPPDSLELAINHLLEFRRDVPAGSFVFVLSDFLRSPSDRVWSRAKERGWDLVPVIIQDPVWEQSFPLVDGLLIPVTDPERGETRMLRFARGEAGERRRVNEGRLQSLLYGFHQLQFDPVVLDDSSVEAVDMKFAAWASRRRVVRGPAR